MILRRVIQHVRDQNWTAVGIDFVIVVVGVFLGIQLGNWNAARADRAEYGRALERFDAEVVANLATLDDLDDEVEGRLERARDGFAALRTCEETEANREAVNRSLNTLVGTHGLHLRRSALDELTSDPALLAQQSAAERQRLADLLFTFEMMAREAIISEFYPQEGRFENNPLIGIGAPREGAFTFYGAEFTTVAYPLSLQVPIPEACRDNDLIKSYRTWLFWQGNVPTAFQAVRSELQETQTLLSEATP
ncbi:hypothetical protein [Rubrivirga sp. IMCC45206]|uniref:hypothetical protein n=1 Tax=Rubrivirga sp. IMCC45206 TaxID=3391614 RepID=UPI0039900352